MLCQIYRPIEENSVTHTHTCAFYWMCDWPQDSLWSVSSFLTASGQQPVDTSCSDKRENKLDIKGLEGTCGSRGAPAWKPALSPRLVTRGTLSGCPAARRLVVAHTARSPCVLSMTSAAGLFMFFLCLYRFSTTGKTFKVKWRFLKPAFRHDQSPGPTPTFSATL